MQKGSALFYHNHITASIVNVDQRTQDYIKHRKLFLRKYCQPLTEKIKNLDQEIEAYNNVIQNQNQMIENQQEVTRLKNEIKDFFDTQGYFLSHLGEYQQQIVKLAMENRIMESKIRRIRDEITGITIKKASQVYNQLSQRDNHKGMKNQDMNNSKISRQKQSGRIMMSQSKSSYSKNHSNNVHNSQKGLLPKIFKVQKYYVSKQTQKIRAHIQSLGIIGVKNKKQKPFTVDVLGSENVNVEVGEEQAKVRQLGNRQNQELSVKQRFKQLMTGFNKFELLFKQCFDRKKAHVQKSVRQLQSKLITNRDRFLQICQAIGEKNVKKVPQSLFETMSGDELMTLMISYPWIQKKLFKELDDKKKQIFSLQSSHNKLG